MPVKPDGPRQADPCACEDPRIRAAKAKPDRKQRTVFVAIAAAKHICGSAGVGGNVGYLRLLHVGHEIEVLRPIACACGPAEVVDGHGVKALLGKPVRQFFIETENPANVGQHNYTCAARLVRHRVVREEFRAVFRRKDQICRTDRRA